VSDTTRALIKSLPGLFAKHQTDEARIAVVLSIPLLMNLDLYVEMRMTVVCPSVGIIFVLLTYLAGLRESMGRHHQAVHFPHITSRPLARRGGDPSPYGRDKSL
jgi:hypothetical protein